MPTFSLVTGRDFGRSNAWAKTQPRLRDIIMKPKPIQRAFFASGPGATVDPEARSDSILRPAIIEIASLQFKTDVPATAAQAEKINNVVLEVCK